MIARHRGIRRGDITRSYAGRASGARQYVRDNREVIHYNTPRR